MLYVLTYDIPSNRRRLKAANVILDYGGRYQKSSFECDLSTDRRYRELIGRLWDVLNPEEDTIRIYRVCGECRPFAKTLGIDTVPEPLQKVLIL
ncbi:CRISPR-associated endonuclease Cas2 [Armatimonas sp.]|uniref:CRISPR-associated endonuclease Cas2 n=1 Tax=Armatimonas sp. TaxID=1872638 RepID=UPI0037517F62